MHFVNALALACLAVAGGAAAANCEDEPCVHGSCEGDATSYACTCDAGFTGANCDVKVEPFSRYPFDGDVLDTAPAGNILDTGKLFPGALRDDDSVCGGSLSAVRNAFFPVFNPNEVPTGSESWTMSIYAKMVVSPGDGLRASMNLGGDGETGKEGFWFGYRKQQLFADQIGNTGIIIDSEWHHYAATYNGSTAKLYFDERE
eukprot:gene22839-35000_t